LTGRIFDDRGNRMSPSHARRRGIKYHYYLSSALFRGRAERTGSIRRIPAIEVETLIINSIREQLKASEPIDERSLVNNHIARVEVQRDQLTIHLTESNKSNRQNEQSESVLQIPWQKTLSTRRSEILLPDARPIRSETRATLVASIARGRWWLDEFITDPSAKAEAIAKREGCSVRKINMTISLAFLAPDLVKAAVEGHLPRGMGVARLCDMPTEWSKQRQMLGLTSADAR
jgi:site-specific DNA recombinase